MLSCASAPRIPLSASWPTVEDGNIALFVVAEHWNAEALGWHVSKRGTRHEALQAVSMAVRQQFGHLGRDAARGLELRHDHGSAFMAEDFQNQIRAWGMLPSYAFVGQPQTNGVIERFFRTFKEQVVHGRIFRNAEEVRLHAFDDEKPPFCSHRTGLHGAELCAGEHVVISAEARKAGKEQASSCSAALRDPGQRRGSRRRWSPQRRFHPERECRRRGCRALLLSNKTRLSDVTGAPLAAHVIRGANRCIRQPIIAPDR